MKNVFYLETKDKNGTLRQRILVEPFSSVGNSIGVTIPYTDISFNTDISTIVNSSGKTATIEEVTSSFEVLIKLFDMDDSKKTFEVSERQKDDLVDLDLIVFDGSKWLLHNCEEFKEFLAK